MTDLPGTPCMTTYFLPGAYLAIGLIFAAALSEGDIPKWQQYLAAIFWPISMVGLFFLSLYVTLFTPDEP